MWIVRTSFTSPFGRKVRIALDLAGLSGKARIEKADTRDSSDPLHQENPLGKIPILVRDDGTAIYDSRVILEFLDLEAGGNVLIPAGGERIAALTMQALADGIMDAALLRRMEQERPEEKRHQPWVDKQGVKVSRALAVFEASPPAMAGTPHVGQIALACALGYLDLRFDGMWRQAQPALVDWLGAFTDSVPAFETTKPA